MEIVCAALADSNVYGQVINTTAQNTHRYKPSVFASCHSVRSSHLVCTVLWFHSHLPGGTCQGGQRLQEIILQLSSLGHSENVCDRWRRRSVLCTIIFQNLIPVAFLYSLCGQYHNHEVHVLLQNSFIISVSLSRSQEATLQHRNLYVSEGTVRVLCRVFNGGPSI